jgi:hypothetical protein
MDNITTGQAIVKHETPTDSTVSISNVKVRSEINLALGKELNEIILSPVTGIQKIRKVLHSYHLDIPALYELEPEGDEVVIEMNQFGVIFDYNKPENEDNESYYLYILYHLTDDGYYEFYAQVTDEEGIEDIMSEDQDLEDV